MDFRCNLERLPIMLADLRRALAVGLLCLVTSVAAADVASSPIAWTTTLDARVFQDAKRQHRFVLLDLHAVWCHWCHVMDESTYTDPHVRSLIAQKYLAVSVDADSDPGLTSRYGDWGWPATIVLAADGTEIVKRRGYIAPPQMASLLQAIIDDPTPGPSVDRAGRGGPAGAAHLSPAQTHAFQQSYLAMYDTEHGGWGEQQKFIDAPSLEYALIEVDHGDTGAEQRVRQTLDANLHLIDPVWGGVYQYSESVDWRSPHFEKLMSFQADDLRLYTEAYARWGEPRDLEAARALSHYIEEFLSGPDGQFYVSQDADLSAAVTGHQYYALDDGGRRRLGLPRVDTHGYARENGWAIRALCRYYDLTGDVDALARATRAAAWVVSNRSLPGGGFRHDAVDAGGPFLDDSTSMGEAFVALYRSTGGRRWLAAAEQALNYVASNLRDPRAGFITAPTPRASMGVFKEPVRAIDQNVAVARLANLVNRYTGNPAYHRIALHAMKLVAMAPSDGGRLRADALVADRELSAAPTHVTIIGSKADPAAQTLHAAALKLPGTYLQIDWWDRAEGPLPNPAISYPKLPVAAAFACSETACSTPVYEAAKLAVAVRTARDAD
jgi:uncharacterized protein